MNMRVGGSWGQLTQVKGIIVLIFVLVLVGGTYSENVKKDKGKVNTSGISERIAGTREWEYFTKVLELLLFQPGRGMGTPWPKRAPYEFRKLTIKNVELCNRCKNLLDNWMNSEPNMILYRAPLYFSKIPHIFLVACGSLELKFTNNDPSDCTKAFKKFSLQKYYEGFSSAPTLRRRASFPATHTDYRPFKPLYLPLESIGVVKVPEKKSQLDLTKHGYVPQTKIGGYTGVHKISYPVPHDSLGIEHRHNYIPVIRKDKDASPNRGYPYFHGIYALNTTHGYIPYIPKNVNYSDSVTSYPASRFGVPIYSNHSYVPQYEYYTLYGGEGAFNETGSLPVSRTKVPIDHTQHGYAPILPDGNDGEFNETGSLPVSRTKVPIDHTQHGYAPILPDGNDGGFNETGSLPVSRTKVPIDHTHHGYAPILQDGNDGGFNETGSLPVSRTKVPIDHTQHGYVPEYVLYLYNSSDIRASYPASRTGLLANTSHFYIPLLNRTSDTQGGYSGLPASRVNMFGTTSFIEHGYIPVFTRSVYNETASYPASRTGIPVDNTNYTYIPYISSDEYMSEGNNTASYPASRTRVPSETRHGYVPVLTRADGGYQEGALSSYPASRFGVPIYSNHSYIPIYEIAGRIYNETGSLPVSRTNVPVDHTSHGYAPIFTRVFVNNTSFLPVSRTGGVPLDIDFANHKYIPLIKRVPEVEHASKPASRTSAPAPGTASCNLPFTILVTLPKVGLPASRTDLPSEDHHYIPLILQKTEDVEPRAAFPATHTNVKAPEKWTHGGEGIEWKHYTEILKLDETGNPYVETSAGRIYGFGDLGTILSQLEERESIEGCQDLIEQA